MLRLLLVRSLLISAWAGVAEDAAITNKLKSKLSRSKLHSDSLQYKVHDGIVEWSGTVRIPQRKGAATRMAKSAGAKRVVNRIVVQTTPRPSTPKSLPRQVTVQIPTR